jgi:competence protein CoiA
MVCCGAKGHLRKSKNGLKHFYHGEKNEECGGEPESLDHLKLKYQIYQICKSEGWQAQPEYESPSRDWRADVFAEKDGRKVVFEIQLSIITLDILKEREAKYRRDGIESYWILKDYMKIPPNDNSKNVSGSNHGVFTYNYINETDLFLYREQLLFVEQGIRSIGIHLEDKRLYTADILAVEIADWVQSALRGEYKKTLEEFDNNHKKKLELRDLAQPEMEKLIASGSRRFGYDSDIKRIYAIFKLNKWEDRPSLQTDIRDMYSGFDTFKKAWGKIFSPKNGFVWRDHLGLDREEPFLNLISENQIIQIHDQLVNLENEEKKFLSIFNVVKDYVEKKDKIISLSVKAQADGVEPVYYRNKKLWRKQLKQQKPIPISKNIENKPPANPKDKIVIKREEIKFEFIPILPALLIESQRGWKYQNPAGCTWEIDKEDALEFESKGYGKIVQN